MELKVGDRARLKRGVCSFGGEIGDIVDIISVGKGTVCIRVNRPEPYGEKIGTVYTYMVEKVEDGK